MKKFAKMSLVAAVAVAGMTTANAKDLAEAIKGVDVSGVFVYEYKDNNRDDKNSKNSSQENEYDLEVTVKAPINDMVTAITKIDVNDEEQNEGANSNVGVDVEDMYFQFNTGYATINVGKQNIPGPFTDGAQGTGIVALVPAGPVTIAAGYFNNHTVNPSTADIAAGTTAETAGAAVGNTALEDLRTRNAMEVAIIGSFGPVNAEAWYADVQDVLDVYNVKASATFGPVTAMVQHTVLDLENEIVDNINDTLALDVDGKNKETNVEVSADLGMFGVKAAYAKTGDDNVWGVAIDRDDDASATWALDQMNVVTKADAKVWSIGVDADVMENVNLAVDYADGEYVDGANDVDMDELLFTATYKMSPNFQIRALYSMYEENSQNDADDLENDKGAIELKYTF